jgi:2-polyprenyl-6-methoxyphenol hydroxylase-like FAD-dependent oxidoreductase
MKALIIGGGIAGPVTALALQKVGIDSVVFEAYETTPDGVGGVLNLTPNGLDALRIVGLGDELVRLGEPVRRMVMADSRGRTLGSLEADEPSRVVWRTDLYRALRAHASALGVKVEHGKRLVGATETENVVTARFADGTTESGDLLVGADGIRSTVRTIIDATAPGPEYVGLQGFGSHAIGSGVRGAPETMYFVFGSSFLGYWQQPDGSIAWFNNLAVKEPMTVAEAREIPAGEWMARLRRAYGDDMPARELLAHSDDLFVAGPLEIMPRVPRWHRDRVVLVGDSAHAPSASSGQGASLAAESGVQLARCLRDIEDLPTAFATYERLRRPRVEKIAARAARTNNNKKAGPVAGAIMRLVMPLAMRFFGRKAFAEELGYRIDWDARI